jgi:hypothetical protein
MKLKTVIAALASIISLNTYAAPTSIIINGFVSSTNEVLQDVAIGDTVSMSISYDAESEPTSQNSAFNTYLNPLTQPAVLTIGAHTAIFPNLSFRIRDDAPNSYDSIEIFNNDSNATLDGLPPQPSTFIIRMETEPFSENQSDAVFSKNLPTNININSFTSQYGEFTHDYASIHFIVSSITNVPEPSSALMFIIGLSAVIFLTKRRVWA